MSWLARSLVNSLKVDEDDNITEDRNTESIKEKEDENQIETPETPGRGVKEDLSELTKSLSRQFWGVASFLAPPPPPSDPSISDWNRWVSSEQSQSGETSDPEIDDSAKIAGIRSDFAEIGGKFKTGISKLSNNKAVSEISKIASTFLPFGSDEGSAESYLVDGVVGVTDEVLTFARNIAMHPETWLDFPLVDDEDSDEFDMSDAQQEHALAVEHLAPRLAALRIELCPGHMTEGCFWKIYFVLLHSRLNKHDAELLSTPQIVQARAMLMQELQNQTKPEPDSSGSSTLLPKEAANSLREECPTSSGNAFSETVSLKTFTFESTTTPVVATDFETEKHPIVSTEMRIIDKSVIEEGPAIQAKNEELLPGFSSIVSDQKYEEDGDDWLEEHSEIGGFSGTTIPLGNEEDVSFSDLEDDDDGGVPSSSKTVVYDSISSTKETQGWVELNRSSANSAKDGQSMGTKHLGSGQLLDNNPETKDPNDWLSVDKVDMI